MRHQCRLFAGLLIVLLSLFATSAGVASDTGQSATGSNSCTAQVPDADYGNVSQPPDNVAGSTSDGDANLPSSSKDVTDAGWWVGYPGTGEPDSGYANLPPSSKDATAATDVAGIYVPIALAPAAYAAQTELFAVAADCDLVLAPVPTWISIQMDEGQDATSTVVATCSRCESTAF